MEMETKYAQHASRRRTGVPAAEDRENACMQHGHAGAPLFQWKPQRVHAWSAVHCATRSLPAQPWEENRPPDDVQIWLSMILPWLQRQLNRGAVGIGNILSVWISVQWTACMQHQTQMYWFEYTWLGQNAEWGMITRPVKA